MLAALEQRLACAAIPNRYGSEPVAYVTVVANVTRPQSLAEAIDLLDDFGPEGAPLAGGTWIMRDWQRGEQRKPHYVVLAGLDELRALEQGDTVSVGALVTHEELARRLTAPAIAALREAARTSAFPAVRSVATIAGNIAAEPFPEADLVPALLACDAEIELAGPGGPSRDSLASLLGRRPRLEPGVLVRRVLIPAPAHRHSAYRRLTVRAGGEYPVASVAVSVDLDASGAVADARVALGSVEEQPRLSRAAAAALTGAPLDGARGQQAGEAAAEECEPRKALDAPGWYRRAVLPTLVREAVERLATETTPA
jgi:aerobic carbon-monoxide dehydrogenase medium subunit